MRCGFVLSFCECSTVALCSLHCHGRLVHIKPLCIAHKTTAWLCRCESWVDRPAILFQISDHENFFHFLNDGFMAVLQTLIETGLLPDRLARRACNMVVKFTPVAWLPAQMH